MNAIKDNNELKRGMRADLNLFEDAWLEPEFEVTKSHIDENGAVVIDECKILSIDLCAKVNK